MNQPQASPQLRKKQALPRRGRLEEGAWVIVVPFLEVRRRLREFSKSALLVNAVYLMLSTFVVAASGFLFWVVVAHVYSTAADAPEGKKGKGDK